MSKKYIKRSVKRNLSERREYSIFTNTLLMLKDPVSEDVVIIDVVKDLEDIIPSKFFNSIDMVIVGQFPELKNTDRRAAYMDGAIYVTNEQPSSEQMLEDIIHEIAHAVESEYNNIYSDGQIEKEYLAKKKRFLDTLSSYGYRVPNRVRVGSEYSKELDDFLFYNIGYENLVGFITGLFLDPYACVSLSEYFAVNFEAYYVSEDIDYLRQVCPVFYKKIEMIHNGEEYEI
jgi:hypothetical protein